MSYKDLAAERGKQLKDSEQRLWEARQQVRELENAAADTRAKGLARRDSAVLCHDSAQEVADLRFNVEAKEARIAELEAALRIQHTQVNETQDRVAGLEKTKDNLDADVAAQQRHIHELGDKLKGQHAEREGTMSDLRAQVEHKTNQIRGLEISRAVEHQSNALLRAELKESTARTTEVDNSLEAQRQENERLEAEVLGKKTKLSGLDNALKAQCKENNHRGNELKRTIASSSELKKSLETQCKKNEQLEHERRGKDAEISGLKDSLQAQCAENEHKVLSLEAELKAKTDRVSELYALLKAQQSVSESAHAYISDLKDCQKNEGTRLTSESEAGSARSVKWVPSEIVYLETTISGLRTETETKERQIHDLHQKLMAASLEKQPAKDGEVEVLKTRLAEAQNDIQKITECYKESGEAL